MKKKYYAFKKPSSRIVVRYCAIALVVLLACASLLPTLLNYAPGSINTAFDIKMSYISYIQQFCIIGLVILFLIFVSTKLLLRDIDKWYLNKDKENYSYDIKYIQKIRKKCFNLPYIIFLFELLLPTIGISAVLFFTGSHHAIMLLKILVIVISFVLLLAVFTYIFSKDLYDQILRSTYEEGINIGIRVNLVYKIAMQILPVFLTVLLLSSFIAYSRSVKEKEDIFYTIYNEKLNSSFDKNLTYDINQIKDILNNLELYNASDSKFIIIGDDVITLTGTKPSDFMIDYTKELSEQYNGRTYDSYGVDTQGATLKLNSSEGICYVGICYNISSNETLYFLFVEVISLLIIISFVLYYFSKSLSNDIQVVTNGLNNIGNDLNPSYSQKLPVISNDEFGDLTQAFNKVQTLNAKQVKLIRNNQETLMERERLASLGQLIGGIAHNLKTPIMSISGAAEGLSDLIKEYDSSIDDPEVNSNDHHDIAKDMNSWVSKIKSYTEYMSDIITAVKGQAVTLSEADTIFFDIEELIKRVDILMKHELKNALIYLNVSLKTPENLKLHGDINSLVQVINNMISNSIQAYEGKPEQNIDLIVAQKDNNLIISIKDYGCGLPDKVKSKLFKEMITTKGKNGTGLGLYMSYSTIKAHFGGEITFESEKGKGTTFHIIIPLN